MKLINRNTDYAVRALCFIAKQKRAVVTVSELSEKLSVPYPFLRRILQRLNKEGLICSSRGKNGGFALATPIQKIFLYDLIGIFQGKVEFASCMIKKSICSDIRTCPLRQEIKRIEDYIVSELKSVTIKSFPAT